MGLCPSSRPAFEAVEWKVAGSGSGSRTVTRRGWCKLRHLSAENTALLCPATLQPALPTRQQQVRAGLFWAFASQAVGRYLSSNPPRPFFFCASFVIRFLSIHLSSHRRLWICIPRSLWHACFASLTETLGASVQHPALPPYVTPLLGDRQQKLFERQHPIASRYPRNNPKLPQLKATQE